MTLPFANQEKAGQWPHEPGIVDPLELDDLHPECKPISNPPPPDDNYNYYSP